MNKLVFLGIVAVFLLTSCNPLELSVPVMRQRNLQGDSMMNPRPMLMRNLPSGDDSYSEGFRAGCHTMIGVVGQGILRINKVDVDGYRMVEDKVYTRGWSDGSTYCTFSLDWDTH